MEADARSARRRAGSAAGWLSAAHDQVTLTFYLSFLSCDTSCLWG